MTSGRLLALTILIVTGVFGAVLWYFTTRAYYEPIELTEITLRSTSGDPIRVALDGAEAIDATSSPLRFRACFTLDPATTAQLLEEAARHPDPVPLIAPAWFDCYTGSGLGGDLEAARAVGLTGTVEFARGVDRVFALYPDGRGFGWQQLNGTLE